MKTSEVLHTVYTQTHEQQFCVWCRGWRLWMSKRGGSWLAGYTGYSVSCTYTQQAHTCVRTPPEVRHAGPDG